MEHEERIAALEEMMTSVSGNMANLASAVRDRLVRLEKRCDLLNKASGAYVRRIERLERLLLVALVVLQNHLRWPHEVQTVDVTNAIRELRGALGWKED